MASHRAAGKNRYVYGTAARDLAAERERTRERRVVQYRQNMSHTVRKNQEKALQMYLPYVGKKITKLLALKEDMDFEMYWDGACSAERILEFAPKGMKGFVLGTTLLFGKDRPYGEILKDIRNLRL